MQERGRRRVTFYTNYESAKGADLARVPTHRVTFPGTAWAVVVHVRGAVTKVSAEETAEYWPAGPAAPSSGRGHPSSPER